MLRLFLYIPMLYKEKLVVQEGSKHPMLNVVRLKRGNFSSNFQALEVSKFNVDFSIAIAAIFMDKCCQLSDFPCGTLRNSRLIPCGLLLVV